MSLHQLGVEHGTDKCDESHTFLGESYLDIYERYLARFREDPIRLLELGVRAGSSLRMWKEYFPAGQIFGVDMNPDCRAHEEERIEVIIASQDDSAPLLALADRVGGFDVVIDDASHINSLTVASFAILFPVVEPGGLYVIEDLGLSWDDYARHIDSPRFLEGDLHRNIERGVPIQEGRHELDALLHDVLFPMDMNRGDVRYVHFWSKLLFIEKAPMPTA